MTRRLCPRSLAVALAALLAVSAAHAEDAAAEFDIGPKFRAKIAKEKAKQAARQSETGARSATNANDASACGSQNIGNIDTGGAVGSAPREVFVFAPNAINLVSGSGCN
ncbi:MAG TPA: hypothetical protein VFZ93_00195 [Albitalea sp.]